MRARTVVGIIVGLVTWWGLFLLSLFVGASLSPAFGEAGRQVQATNDYSSLTTGMFVALLGMYVYVNGVAGWVTAKVARRRFAVWIVGAPLVAYAAYQHLFVLWDDLPGWYNLGVIAFIYPFAFLGAALAGPARLED